MRVVCNTFDRPVWPPEASFGIIKRCSRHSRGEGRRKIIKIWLKNESRSSLHGKRESLVGWTKCLVRYERIQRNSGNFNETKLTRNLATFKLSRNLVNCTRIPAILTGISDSSARPVFYQTFN